MTFAVQTSQLDRSAASLRQLSGQLDDLADTDTEAARLIASAGQPLVPRATGALAASLTVRAGSVVSQLPYAAPVHWGWQRGGTTVAARPWLLQARDSATQDVLELYAEHVTQLIGRVE